MIRINAVFALQNFTGEYHWCGTQAHVDEQLAGSYRHVEGSGDSFDEQEFGFGIDQVTLGELLRSLDNLTEENDDDPEGTRQFWFGATIGWLLDQTVSFPDGEQRALDRLDRDDLEFTVIETAVAVRIQVEPFLRNGGGAAINNAAPQPLATEFRARFGPKGKH